MADGCDSGELICRRAQACQKVVDEALEKRTGVEEFIERLKGVGAIPAEATDYGRQYTDRLEQCAVATPTQASKPLPAREVTPEGLDDTQRAAFCEACDRELADANAQANCA